METHDKEPLSSNATNEHKGLPQDTQQSESLPVAQKFLADITHTMGKMSNVLEVLWQRSQDTHRSLHVGI